jgi:hypothetical protein
MKNEKRRRRRRYIYTYTIIIDIAIASILLCVATPSAVPEAMADHRCLTSVSSEQLICIINPNKSKEPKGRRWGKSCKQSQVGLVRFGVLATLRPELSVSV